MAIAKRDTGAPIKDGWRIDALQYGRWSEKIFLQMREARLDAVHVTLAYHETFREAVREVEAWNRRFLRHADLLRHARNGADIREARRQGMTAVLFGFQTPSPIEDDPGLVEVWHALGLRFMQLTYNRQSLLAAGWQEEVDGGVTVMGREVIAEMNRLGVIVDLSHTAERSCLDAIEASSMPVAATHANPRSWRDTGRNKSEAVIAALAETGGMLGLSLYPHHLRGGSACALEDFCAMAAGIADRHGINVLGIGSDLCQDQPDEVVAWMRQGRWPAPPGAEPARFPDPLPWFEDSRGFASLHRGLRAAGFDERETAAVLGGNWLRFLDRGCSLP